MANIAFNQKFGLIIAFSIILLWAGHLVLWLITDITAVPVPLVILGVFVQMFLYTGLFITAHDAMHGLIWPRNKSVNERIGRFSVIAYALFSYRQLLEKHHLHHRFPGTAGDPDFHRQDAPGFWAWYIHFMLNYLGWWQLLGMAVLFNILDHLAGLSALNLFLFWVLPALLSTLQLFYFGTYLPHQREDEPFKDHHRARSNDYPVWLSFITCYHFGYHWEHHAYTHIPWWKLPHIRRTQHEAT